MSYPHSIYKNSIYPQLQDYTRDFCELVKNTVSGDFIGFGNPAASLLIIGRKATLYVLDKDRDATLNLMEIVQNHDDWDKNIKKNTKASDNLTPYIPKSGGVPITSSIGLQSALPNWNGIFNPLWPYIPLPSSADMKTWTAYQKLLYGTAFTNDPNIPYFFWMNAFVTEINQKNINELNTYLSELRKYKEDKKHGNKASKKPKLKFSNTVLFHPFFKGFPMVVIEYGNDINELLIEALFGEVDQIAPEISYMSNSGISSKNIFFKVYQTKNRKQKIVVSSQLSDSDSLIDAIREKFEL
ncbi:MAG: hypothetical protein LKF31_05455 [Muribaculaceae bacterium]|jgi:hypothetical protein|nr:hypothetical protein [Muribaculaceae bacterium]